MRATRFRSGFPDVNQGFTIGDAMTFTSKVGIGGRSLSSWADGFERPLARETCRWGRGRLDDSIGSQPARSQPELCVSAIEKGRCDKFRLKSGRKLLHFA